MFTAVWIKKETEERGGSDKTDKDTETDEPGKDKGSGANTGDETGIMLWLTAMALSGGLAYRRAKKKQ